jgi:hypothetical protein
MARENVMVVQDGGGPVADQFPHGSQGTVVDGFVIQITPDLVEG